MPLKHLLSPLLDADIGIQDAIVADWEGEAVDWISRERDGDDIKIFGAHQGILLRHVQHLVGQMAGGCLKELVIRTECADWFVFPLTSEYYLALSVARGGCVAQVSSATQNCRHQLYLEIEAD